MTDDTHRVNPPANRHLHNANAIFAEVLHGPSTRDGIVAWVATLGHEELAEAAVILAARLIGVYGSYGVDSVEQLQRHVLRANGVR
jgi:hypothetical protein